MFRISGHPDPSLFSTALSEYHACIRPVPATAVCNVLLFIRLVLASDSVREWGEKVALASRLFILRTVSKIIMLQMPSLEYIYTPCC